MSFFMSLVVVTSSSNWVPAHFTSFRYSIIHFLVGVGVTPLHMVMLSTVPWGASGKKSFATNFASLSRTSLCLMSFFSRSVCYLLITL